VVVLVIEHVARCRADGRAERERGECEGGDGDGGRLHGFGSRELFTK
jgi:hypothetical protein